MTELSPQLCQLAAEYGVETEYWDWGGTRVVQPAETLVAVLRALDVDASTPAAIAAAFEERRRERWLRMLPPCLVTRQGLVARFEVHVSHGADVDVWIELEDGEVRRDIQQVDNWTPPQAVDGGLVGEASFASPADLPLGYHTLRARSDGDEAASPLIVTPAWLGMPERLGARRAWGMTTQLYSVRSARSWGVGDLTDLTDLTLWSAQLGADFVLVNPLHAAEPVPPMEPSPYLPTSRRFSNPLYLRVDQIPEYAYLPAADRAEVDRLHDNLTKLLDGVDTIDRDESWRSKRAALWLVHAVPRSAGRDLAYRAYRQREGEGLDDFATWCVLAEHNGADWRAWPEPLRHPRSPAVTAFRARHASDIDFHRWQQWVLDEQLDAAQAAARRAGMAIGVLHDLAVGVNPRGADAWALQDSLARGVHVGAPPDAFNQLGQDWNQPPWRPDRLAELAYRPFRDLVATVVRHAGGVRVDHIIGLFRLWWIPAGSPPTGGVYVRYDQEAMVGILALEAYRAGALVVGEDLGVVEPSTRAHLAERGILGTSILWFEYEFAGDGRPLRPEYWREYCLASVTTHDLPPTAGYLAGDHIRLRDSLGLLTRPLEEELAVDTAARDAWLAELHRRSALPLDADTEQIVAALHAYLALTPAKLVGVALTDAVGDRRTQNQPGTINEYPNWRVRLSGEDGQPMLLEDVLRSARASRLAAVLRGIGQQAPTPAPEQRV